jgi:hypothetical protein
LAAGTRVSSSTTCLPTQAIYNMEPTAGSLYYTKNSI